VCIHIISYTAGFGLGSADLPSHIEAINTERIVYKCCHAISNRVPQRGALTRVAITHPRRYDRYLSCYNVQRWFTLQIPSINLEGIDLDQDPMWWGMTKSFASCSLTSPVLCHGHRGTDHAGTSSATGVRNGTQLRKE
jgi:hypothetical protein